MNVHKIDQKQNQKLTNYVHCPICQFLPYFGKIEFLENNTMKNNNEVVMITHYFPLGQEEIILEKVVQASFRMKMREIVHMLNISYGTTKLKDRAEIWEA